MSIMLFNPTNEVFDGLSFGGRSYCLKPGEKIKVDDACGKHLLNAFSSRGLCVLEYGDDENKIAEDGRRRNRAFKEKMIRDYNYMSVSRKNQGLPYISPTDYVKAAAHELGMELDQPYVLKQAQPQQSEDWKEVINSIQSEISRLGDALNSITKMVLGMQQGDQARRQR